MKYGSGPDVLRDIDLLLQAGSFHLLVGASGAGKTTLLRTIALGQPLSSGRLTLFGQDPTALDRAERAALRRRIGLVFQDLRLIDQLTVFDNVALPLRISGREPAEITGPVVELLGWLGMDGLLGRRPPELSMAERQLVAAARAVIGRPALLLADEPTASMDAVQTGQLLHLFLELNRTGTAVLLATHDAGLLGQDRVVHLVVHDGRLWVPEPAPANPDGQHA